MKKKYNIKESYDTVNSLSLRNTFVSDKAKNDEINEVLLRDIDAAAINADIKVTITTAITGHRRLSKAGYVSRHVNGNAVDIAIINGKSWSNRQDAIGKNIYDGIERFVKNMKNMGYVVNAEQNNEKAILYFGFSDGEHENHLHISNKTSTPSDTDFDNNYGDDYDIVNNDNTTDNLNITTSSSGLSPMGYAKNLAKKMISHSLGLKVNESENKDLLEEIKRIKSLL